MDDCVALANVSWIGGRTGGWNMEWQIHRDVQFGLLDDALWMMRYSLGWSGFRAAPHNEHHHIRLRMF